MTVSLTGRLWCVRAGTLLTTWSLAQQRHLHARLLDICPMQPIGPCGYTRPPRLHSTPFPSVLRELPETSRAPQCLADTHGISLFLISWETQHFHEFLKTHREAFQKGVLPRIGGADGRGLVAVAPDISGLHQQQTAEQLSLRQRPPE